MEEAQNKPPNEPSDNCEKSKCSNINYEDVRKRASNWTLGADDATVTLLQQISNKLVSKSSEVEKTLSKINQQFDKLNNSLANASTSFHLLSYRQYIENRTLQESDAECCSKVTPEEGCTEATVKSGSVDVRKEAIDLGLKLLTEAYEKVELSDSESEEAGLDESCLTVFKLKNDYKKRALPHIIGSDEFYQSPYVGLWEPPQSDSNEAKISSSSEDEVEVEKDLQKRLDVSRTAEEIESDEDSSTFSSNSKSSLLQSTLKQVVLPDVSSVSESTKKGVLPEANTTQQVPGKSIFDADSDDEEAEDIFTSSKVQRRDSSKAPALSSSSVKPKKERSLFSSSSSEDEVEKKAEGSITAEPNQRKNVNEVTGKKLAGAVNLFPSSVTDVIQNTASSSSIPKPNNENEPSAFKDENDHSKEPNSSILRKGEEKQKNQIDSLFDASDDDFDLFSPTSQVVSSSTSDSTSTSKSISIENASNVAEPKMPVPSAQISENKKKFSLFDSSSSEGEDFFAPPSRLSPQNKPKSNQSGNRPDDYDSSTPNFQTPPSHISIETQPNSPSVSNSQIQPSSTLANTQSGISTSGSKQQNKKTANLFSDSDDESEIFFTPKKDLAIPNKRVEKVPKTHLFSSDEEDSIQVITDQTSPPSKKSSEKQSNDPNSTINKIVPNDSTICTNPVSNELESGVQKSDIPSKVKENEPNEKLFCDTPKQNIHSSNLDKASRDTKKSFSLFSDDTDDDDDIFSSNIPTISSSSSKSDSFVNTKQNEGLNAYSKSSAVSSPTIAEKKHPDIRKPKSGVEPKLNVQNEHIKVTASSVLVPETLISAQVCSKVPISESNRENMFEQQKNSNSVQEETFEQSQSSKSDQDIIEQSQSSKSDQEDIFDQLQSSKSDQNMQKHISQQSNDSNQEIITKKPVGGIQLFAGNELADKLKARRQSFSDDDSNSGFEDNTKDVSSTVEKSSNIVDKSSDQTKKVPSPEESSSKVKSDIGSSPIDVNLGSSKPTVEDRKSISDQTKKLPLPEGSSSKVKSDIGSSPIDVNLGSSKATVKDRISTSDQTKKLPLPEGSSSKVKSDIESSPTDVNLGSSKPTVENRISASSTPSAKTPVSLFDDSDDDDELFTSSISSNSKITSFAPNSSISSQKTSNYDRSTSAEVEDIKSTSSDKVTKDQPSKAVLNPPVSVKPSTKVFETGASNKSLNLGSEIPELTNTSQSTENKANNEEPTSPVKKPVGGIQLFGGDELLNKLKARKQSSSEDESDTNDRSQKTNTYNNKSQLNTSKNSDPHQLQKNLDTHQVQKNTATPQVPVSSEEVIEKGGGTLETTKPSDAKVTAIQSDSKEPPPIKPKKPLDLKLHKTHKVDDSPSTEESPVIEKPKSHVKSPIKKPAGGFQLFGGDELLNKLKTRKESGDDESDSSDIKSPLFNITSKETDKSTGNIENKVDKGSLKTSNTEKLLPRKPKNPLNLRTSGVDKDQDSESTDGSPILEKPQSSIKSPIKKPAGGIQLFGGNELLNKLKARKQSSSEDECDTIDNKSPLTNVTSESTMLTDSTEKLENQDYSNTLETSNSSGKRVATTVESDSNDHTKPKKPVDLKIPEKRQVYQGPKSVEVSPVLEKPQSTIKSPIKKPVGGIQLFGGNELLNKLKARKQSSSDDDTSDVTDSTKPAGDDATQNTSTTSEDALKSTSQQNLPPSIIHKSEDTVDHDFGSDIPSTAVLPNLNKARPKILHQRRRPSKKKKETSNMRNLVVTEDGPEVSEKSRDQDSKNLTSEDATDSDKNGLKRSNIAKDTYVTKDDSILTPGKETDSKETDVSSTERYDKIADPLKDLVSPTESPNPLETLGDKSEVALGKSYITEKVKDTVKSPTEGHRVDIKHAVSSLEKERTQDVSNLSKQTGNVNKDKADKKTDLKGRFNIFSDDDDDDLFKSSDTISAPKVLGEKKPEETSNKSHSKVGYKQMESVKHIKNVPKTDNILEDAPAFLPECGAPSVKPNTEKENKEISSVLSDTDPLNIKFTDPNTVPSLKPKTEKENKEISSVLSDTDPLNIKSTYPNPVPSLKPNTKKEISSVLDDSDPLNMKFGDSSPVPSSSIDLPKQAKETEVKKQDSSQVKDDAQLQPVQKSSDQSSRSRIFSNDEESSDSDHLFSPPPLSKIGKTKTTDYTSLFGDDESDDDLFGATS